MEKRSVGRKTADMMSADVGETAPRGKQITWHKRPGLGVGMGSSALKSAAVGQKRCDANGI